jgi:Flp pilus assembly protein TadD
MNTPVDRESLQSVIAAEQALIAGDLDRAAQLAQGVLVSRPEVGLALNVLGIVAAKQNNAQVAVMLWETATRAAPAVPQPWVSLGEAFFHIGQFDKAVHCFREALQRGPELHDVRANLGVALQQVGQHEDAVNQIRHALVGNPNHSEATLALATSLHHLGRTHQAIDTLTLAARRFPNHPKFLSNLGVLYDKLSPPDLEASVEWYNKALAISPNDPQTLFNRGSSLIQLLKIADARRDWEQALRLDPNNATTATNLAILELLDGNFLKGFEMFEHRWAVRHQKFPIQAREWAGEPLDRKHLLLFVEQGLGDMLQFCRFVPELKKQHLKSRITLVTLPTLHPLLRSLEGLDDVADVHPPYPIADYQLSLLSVPRVLRTTLETVPAKVPYLRADAARTAKWRERIGGGNQLKIGLFWQGTKVDENRTIRLSDLAPLWDAAPGAHFISLQKGPGEEEIGPFARPVTAVGHELLDYADTAAVLSLLDLVVTIDTSLAHAAGAMARPTFTLLPYRPDWRWLLGRTDSPWYPTMRLFRQEKRRDWSGTIPKLAHAVREFALTRS